MQTVIRKVFPILAFAIFSSMLGMGVIAPILPIYAEELGATGVWLGLIFSGFALARTVIIPFVGRLSDLKGRKPILALGLLSFAIISLGYVWSDNLAGLIVVRLLHGIGSGLVGPIAQACVGDLSPPGQEGRWMGYFSAAMVTGFGFGPLMGGTLAEHLGTDAAFFAMGGLNLLAFLGVVLFFPGSASSQRDAGAVPAAPIRDMLASRRIWGVCIIMAGVSAGRGMMITFLPLFGSVDLGLSSSLVGVLLTTQIISGSLFQVISGRLADRYDRRAIVVLAGLFLMAGLSLVPASLNFWMLFVFGLMFSIGDSGILPATSAIAVEDGRRFGMGAAMGLWNMAMGAGMSVGPILAGLVADSLGVDFAFYFTAAFMLVCTGLFSLLTRR
jgi:MFS family permease